ncbi:MAG: hypothetical protein VR65_26890 [Desulfobulbaceae bacterium BRH_c16a]|nr:MAG: hypothetical protein VR65_26890 [Desulfobulbaceae bacterium BRH_c16a]
MARKTSLLSIIRRGRENTLPERIQQHAARIAVAPMREVEKGIKKQQRMMKKFPATSKMERVCVSFLILSIDLFGLPVHYPFVGC